MIPPKFIISTFLYFDGIITEKLPDFDFVQGILDVINGIEAVAEEYPEFHNALTKRKLADTRELLKKRGAEHNPTIVR